MQTDTRKIYQKKRFWAGLLLAQFVLYYALSHIPAVVKVATEFFRFYKELQQWLWQSVPFSIGDVFYMVLAGIFVFLFVQVLRKNTRTSAALRLLILFNALYFVYQLVWGMLYFQAPIADSLPSFTITRHDAERLALVYLERCRQTRELVPEDTNGVFKVYDVMGVRSEILRRQNMLPEIAGFMPATQSDIFKPSLFSFVMSYTGILGYYNPFSTEAQFNPRLPSTQLPFTLAHENAHQLGYAREHEASFIGYLIAKDSDIPELRYSIEYYTLKSLLGAIAPENPEFVKYIIRSYSPGMKRDRMAEKMFFRRHQGALDTFFGISNDLFLKSNRQAGSVTYSYFVDLLLRYEANKKESLPGKRF